MATKQATIDTLAIFKGIATAHASTLTGLDVIKGHIETLKGAKIVFGKSVKTCQYRQQCTDAYVQAFPKLSKKTIANYVTAVVDCVTNGTVFSLDASKGQASKGKKGTGGKATEKTGQEKMIGALLNVWKLSDVGEDVLVEIETIMADAIPLIDAIQMVLQKAGEKLDGVESPE